MKIKASLAIVTLYALAAGMQAEVKPNALFSDNAVLQQNAKVPVWGAAAPNESVTVEFAGQKKIATTDAQGRWKVMLDPMPASAEPRDLTISGNLKSQISNVKCANVLVGEVWVCSGQSNMAWPLKQAGNAATETPTANYPKLRMFTVTQKTALFPQTELTGKWVECSPANVGNFSAVGYFFGRDIHKATGAPVGMVHTSWGGTPAESWTSLTGMEKEPSLHGYVETVKSLMENHDAASAKLPQEIADYQAKLKVWNEKVGWPLKKADEAWAKENAKNLEDGKPPVRRPAPSEPRPTPPASLDGGNHGPTTLYNAMIAPLIPYAIKGAIWYQGESNAGKGFEYRTLFPRMITDWREKWGQGDFPFLFVQLAPLGGRWTNVWEAQLLTWKKIPNTGMAVTTDVGGSLHPLQKEPVGARLALAARAVAYGEKIEYSGPEYDSFKIEQGRVIITFKHVGGGLVAKDGPLNGFTMAGADKKFLPAKAEIQGDTVVVTSEKITSPVAVRYLWVRGSEMNLWNKAELPASPFWTDPESLTEDASAPKTR